MLTVRRRWHSSRRSRWTDAHDASILFERDDAFETRRQHPLTTFRCRRGRLQVPRRQPITQEVPVAITRKSHTDIRWRRALAALLAGAFGGALLLGIAVPAAADTGARTEDYPQAIAGNVRAEGEPLEGVIVRVTGDDGFEGEDETDAKGTWRVPVPSKDGVWSVELVE